MATVLLAAIAAVTAQTLVKSSALGSDAHFALALVCYVIVASLLRRVFETESVARVNVIWTAVLLPGALLVDALVFGKLPTQRELLAGAMCIAALLLLRA